MTGQRIRLRKVRDGDADDLARAWRDQGEVYAGLAPDVFAVPSGDDLGDWLVTALASQADPDHRLVLVADIDGRAVGFLVAAVVAPHEAARHMMQRELSRPRVQIEALVVQRAHWRGGVGRRLVRAAEDWARNRGAVAISTQAYLQGPAAEFLGAVGYTPRATVYGKPLPPAERGRRRGQPDDGAGNSP